MWKRLRRKSPKGRQSIWQSEKTDGTAGRISDEIKRIFVLNRKERRGSSGRKSAEAFGGKKDRDVSDRPIRGRAALDQWKAEAEVKTTGVFDKMTLSNLWDYVK